MYTKQEASIIRKSFWTSFGQYMKPLPDAEGKTINWLNYKTGVKHIYFRLDADNKRAAVAIELTHPDPEQKENDYHHFLQLKAMLTETTGQQWQWEKEGVDEDSRSMSRISIQLKDVNVFDRNDWPAIITFLKSAIISLDKFWNIAKESFQ